MPSADVLAQIAAIIVAITGLFTAITAAAAKLKIDKIHTIAKETAHEVASPNGTTLGDNAEATRNVIAPKAPDETTPPPTP